MDDESSCLGCGATTGWLWMIGEEHWCPSCMVREIERLRAKWAPTTDQLLYGSVPNPIDSIARSRGWLPLGPGESMSVGYNDARYTITREKPKEE